MNETAGFDDVLDIFRMLSDPTRLKIVLLLLEKERCVCEIFGALEMSQPRVSRQLAILKQTKIIRDKRVGKWIFYRIDEAAYNGNLKKILTQVPEWIESRG